MVENNLTEEVEQVNELPEEKKSQKPKIIGGTVFALMLVIIAVIGLVNRRVSITLRNLTDYRVTKAHFEDLCVSKSCSFRWIDKDRVRDVLIVFGSPVEMGMEIPGSQAFIRIGEASLGKMISQATLQINGLNETVPSEEELVLMAEAAKEIVKKVELSTNTFNTMVWMWDHLTLITILLIITGLGTGTFLFKREKKAESKNQEYKNEVVLNNSLSEDAV